MRNVGIKFKEFVYIYNFTCFELKRMDLKCHEKGRNQKKLFNFQHKTNFNVELQESNSMNWTNIICSTSIYIYKSRDLMWESMRFCQVAHCITSFSFRLSPHLYLAFMSNYYVMTNAFF